MVIDALRRRAPYYWFLVMLAFPTVGAVAYLVIVKLRQDYGRSRRGALDKLEPEVLQELATHLERLPSNQARLELGGVLETREQYRDAAQVFGQILHAEGGITQGTPDAMSAAHGLARCKLSLGEPSVALDLLAEVLDIDREFANYRAVLDCAEALHASGKTADAAQMLEGLATLTGRINHRVALAHFLELNGQASDASDVLQQALADYAKLPRTAQRRDKRWADRAAQKLAELLASDSTPPDSTPPADYKLN